MGAVCTAGARVLSRVRVRVRRLRRCCRPVRVMEADATPWVGVYTQRWYAGGDSTLCEYITSNTEESVTRLSLTTF